MADKNWKGAERRVAKYLGGERIPVPGREAADVKAGFVRAEVKYRVMPKWINHAHDQISGNVTEDQLGIVVLVDHRQPIGKAKVQMTLEDFVRWYDPSTRGDVSDDTGEYDDEDA